MDPSIPIPKSPQEALEQRLTKYQSGFKSARTEGNSSKARRMVRIVIQYKDALKALKAGEPVDFAELPVPPGYPPIPVGETSSYSSIPLDGASQPTGMASSRVLPVRLA